MTRDAIQRAEDWLQYFSDLGFHSTYRDRISLQPVSAGNSSCGTAEVNALQPPADARLHDSAPASTSRALESSPATVNMDQPTAKLSSPLPAVNAPSLFDAADQVQGDTLEKIRETIGDCTRCRLHEKRTNIVFGVGNPKAQLMFVGEGPGRDEDIQGEPFVGRAGKLLTQMIEAMGLQRVDVYIANVVKCRPPDNRTPEKDEMATCSPFLFRQIDVIRPKVIICLGAVAVQALLGPGVGITKTRGQWFDYRGSCLMPTYHPAYLLRNPAAKKDVWEDLKLVMAHLGLKPPAAARPRASGD